MQFALIIPCFYFDWLSPILYLILFFYYWIGILFRSCLSSDSDTPQVIT